jgi:hypothetical protein
MQPCEKDAEEAKAACKGDSKYSRENDAFAARLPGLCEHDFIASKRRLRERRDPLASSTSRAAHPLDRRRHFALPVSSRAPRARKYRRPFGVYRLNAEARSSNWGVVVKGEEVDIFF